MWLIRPALISAFRSVKRMRVYDPPGPDTNPSQVSPQQKLVLVNTAESTGGSLVRCLAQGHTTQWSGWSSNSRPLGYE